MPYIGRNHVAGDHTSNFKVLDDISSYTATFDGSSATIVSTADETIRIPEHRFIQGQRVTYSNGGGGNIGGLTNGTAYFVTFDTANTFKLATSLANANNNTNINLSSVGSGSSHTLTAAFDGVNTTFKITHGGGSSADIVNSAQLQIAINNVIQKANLDSSYTEGFLVVDSRKIQFKTAPTVDDIFWGNIIANTIETFDISDLKIDQFTGDGTTTQFTLSRDVPNNQSVMVTLDGVVQHPSDKDTTRAYRILADTVIEFSSPPGLSIEIQVRHLGFSGAATGDVSGFYGRTGNVVLGASDHITTGDITPRNINASGIITATSFIGSGAALTGIDATAIKDSGGNVKVQAQASGAVYTGIHTFTTLKSTSADFSGNVSIGGTLTYEDVTNIDSVGIITARNDLKVGTGVTITPAGAGFFSGIVTATSFTGDGANITGVAVTEAPVLSYEIFGPNNNQYFWWGGGVDVTEPNPDLFLQRGQMYRFVNNAGSAHPLEIRYAQSGPEFTSGVRGDKTGVQLFTVPYDAPAKLRYQCVPHTNMGGAIYIRGADGNQEKVGLTTFRNAINIQSDDSSPGRIRFYCEVNNIHYVTLKAPAHANFSGYPVVTLPNITGTLLTSNNANISGIVTATGADINGDLDVDGHTNLDNVSIAGVVTATSFVGSGANLTSLPTQVTISNNADDRVITGGSGVNLNGESTMTYTSNTLKLTDAANDTSLLHLVGGGTATRGLKIGTSQATGASQNDGAAVYDAINSESSGYGSQHRFKIAGTDCFTIGYNGDFGYVGVNETVPYPDAVSGNTVNTCLELGSPSGTDTSSVIRFNGRDGGGNLNRCQIQWAGANNRFDITVNGNQALQIQANKDVEVTDGDLVIGTAGHGINFSNAGGSNAGSSSATLDDYEEGSFTAILRSNSNPANTNYTYDTSSNFTSYYTKIGNIVYVSISLSNLHTSPDLRNHQLIRVEGLPFTTARRCGLSVVDGRGIYPRWASDSQTTNAATTTVWADGSSTMFYLQFYMHYTPYTAWATVHNSTSSQRWHIAGCYPVA